MAVRCWAIWAAVANRSAPASRIAGSSVKPASSSAVEPLTAAGPPRITISRGFNRSSSATVAPGTATVSITGSSATSTVVVSAEITDAAGPAGGGQASARHGERGQRLPLASLGVEALDHVPGVQYGDAPLAVACQGDIGHRR